MHVIQVKFPETGKIKTGYYIATSFKNKSELENAQFDMTNYAKVDQRNMEASKCPTETSEFYIWYLQRKWQKQQNGKLQYKAMSVLKNIILEALKGLSVQLEITQWTNKLKEVQAKKTHEIK